MVIFLRGDEGGSLHWSEGVYKVTVQALAQRVPARPAEARVWGGLLVVFVRLEE